MSLLRFAMFVLAASSPLGLLAADLPAVVSVVGSDGKGVVAELGRENETHIEILDLKTGEKTTLAKAELKALREDLSEKSVIDRVGLPTYMAWRVHKAAPEGTIAVLPITASSGDETEGGGRLADEIAAALVNRGLSVVERRLLAQTLGELVLQQGWAFDSAKATKIGGQLGASAIVVGTVRADGKLAERQLRLVAVETGEILVAVTHSAKDEAAAAEVAGVDSKRTEGLIVGTFEVLWTEGTGKRGFVTYEFEADGTALKAERKIGTWRAEGTTVHLQYLDKARGSVVISPTDRATFKAVHTWANGNKSSWIGKRED